MIRAGRRWGKTTLLEREAIKQAALGRAVGWFVPTYKLVVPTYRKVVRSTADFTESASKIDQSIRLETGGSVDFWTLQDENAGRSRKYDLVIIDEASLVPDLRDIFEQSIAPTLLDRAGSAVMAGTPKGQDPESYFWLACTDKTDPLLAWTECYAPTSANPTLPREEIDALALRYPPKVYQQEYLAEFVDWRGDAFFALDSLLVDGKGIEAPRADTVFAVIDTALKDGSEHDATGVVYYARNWVSGPPLVILDWDIVRIDSDLLSGWLPAVFRRLAELQERHRARRGCAGVWIEDRASGITLLQHAQRSGTDAHALPEKLTAQGKDGRAFAASEYVYRGDVKLSAEAYEKTVSFDGVTRNQLIAQVCGFRVANHDKHQMDLLDCFTYGVLIGLGNDQGF